MAELRGLGVVAAFPTPLEEPSELAPRGSEESLALSFADKHESELRYVEEWRRWLVWDGVRWRPDATLAAQDHVRALVRQNAAELYGPANYERRAVALASARTATAVEKLARSDRRLAATTDQWDGAPLLLATPAGYVDLQTGAVRPAAREAFVTRCTAVAPAEEGAPHPLWDAFLERVTDGDEGLVAFLQRVAGYTLTGLTSEHALFFLYGTGRNGKGVFLNTVSRILGDYAQAAAMETFTEQRHAQHPADLALLRGARLVTAQETEEGRRWAEARIKQLTGGDPIAARFMRQDFFTFLPQFKLMIAGNHKPSLRSVDEAVRARLHLVPFTVTIPVEERDKALPEKLRAEGPAILRWAIEGCLAWQAEGLAPPACVRSATEDYLAAEDLVAQWLAECCEPAPGAKVESSALFRSWTEWAEAAGEHPGSQKQFAKALFGKGFGKGRVSGGRSALTGLQLKRTGARGASE